MRRVIIASNNTGKIKEIKDIFATQSYSFLSLKDIGFTQEILEDQDNFCGNALKKALSVMNQVGELTLADDSGLEVDFLGGQPGVLSARFSGENATDQSNNEKLLKLLDGVPMDKRGARFRCVVVITSPKGQKFVAEGVCPGAIGNRPRGENGFGYDPIFIPQGLNRTFAQLDDWEKNQISHRYMALTKLKNMFLGLD